MLKEAVVTDIKMQPDGSLRICSSNGLYFLDKKRGVYARYSESDSGSAFLPASIFFDCVRDEDGSYWLATGSGLIHWNKAAGTYRAFTTAEGLSNDVIYAVYPDRHNRLWLPSDYGLMCFNKASGAIKTYLTGDGISSNEFNRISHCRDSAGNFYFGTINGVTAFHPDDFRRDTYASQYPLVITAFSQFDGKSARLLDRTAELLRTRTITLQPQDRFFTLELSLLNFTDPEHTSYLWKIDGLSEWHMQTDRTLRLSSPPYGDYKLRVKAKASDGTPGANEIVIDLHVPAPFYRGLPFLGGMLLLLAGSIWAVVYRRNRRIRLEKRRLERTVHHRTAALQTALAQKDVLMKEIHHRVKNNLQVISALQQMQSSRSNDPLVKAALEESQNRVLSIAFIHHNLYMHDDLKGVEMQSFVPGADCTPAGGMPVAGHAYSGGKKD